MEVKQCNDYPLLSPCSACCISCGRLLKGCSISAIAGILAVFNRKDSSNQSIDFYLFFDLKESNNIMFIEILTPVVVIF